MEPQQKKMFQRRLLPVRFYEVVVELEDTKYLHIIGKGGLINSKWVMVMDFPRIEKEHGSLPIRIVDHVTFMYFLAFFIDKDNPRGQGKSSLSLRFIGFFYQNHINYFPTGFNTVVGRLRDGGIIDHLMFQVLFLRACTLVNGSILASSSCQSSHAREAWAHG